ncbi:MAG: hypothetical protein AAB553_05605 [Patescibacteria group bacterium]
MNQRKNLLIVGSIIFVLLLGAFIAGLLIPTSEPSSTKTVPTTSPKPTLGIQRESSAVRYDEEKMKKAEQILVDHKMAAPSEEALRVGLTQKKNPLYTDEYVIITYNQQYNSFFAEIHNSNLHRAKRKAIEWFKLQGFREASLCDLPVVFTINERDAEQLRKFNIVFDPLPPGC